MRHTFRLFSLAFFLLIGTTAISAQAKCQPSPACQPASCTTAEMAKCTPAQVAKCKAKTVATCTPATKATATASVDQAKTTTTSGTTSAPKSKLPVVTSKTPARSTSSK